MSTQRVKGYEDLHKSGSTFFTDNQHNYRHALDRRRNLEAHGTVEDRLTSLEKSLHRILEILETK